MARKPTNPSSSALKSACRHTSKSLPYVPRTHNVRPQAAANWNTQSPRLTASRRIALVGACVAGATIAFYSGGLVTSLLAANGPTSEPKAAAAAAAAAADVSDRYDDIAGCFDGSVDGAERVLGLGRLRRRLVAGARGDVLEVSAGTGRNTTFYDWQRVRRLVLLDRSGPMLQVARNKWERSGCVGLVEFRVQSAFERMHGPGPDEAVVQAEEGGGGGCGGCGEFGKFDTIVQTMGLCSTPQPERLLQCMEAVLKCNGRILLLEHGRASYGWLNRLLDKSAPAHADKHGCWWNRDIGAIVRSSSLEIVRINRPWYHLGTTWCIELRKRHQQRGECGSVISYSGLLLASGKRQ